MSRYYFGKWPFPEDVLKGLSPPTDDLGISLLKSMLVIQPEDRLTATGALSHGWLAELKSEGEDSGGEGVISGRCKNTLATQDRQEIGRDEKNTITEDHRGCISEAVALGEDAGTQIGSDASAPETRIATYLVTVPVSDTASAGGSAVRTRHRKLRPTSHNSQVPYSKSLKAPRKKQLPDISPTCPQSRTPSTTNFNLHIRPVANCDWMLKPRLLTSYLRAPSSHKGDSLRSIRAANDMAEYTPKSACNASKKPAPNTCGRGDGRNQNGRAINPLQNPGAERNLNTGWDPNRNPNFGWNPNQNPKASRNPNRNPDTSRNTHKNPNACWNPNIRGNRISGRNGRPSSDRAQIVGS